MKTIIVILTLIFPLSFSNFASNGHQENLSAFESMPFEIRNKIGEYLDLKTLRNLFTINKNLEKEFPEILTKFLEGNKNIIFDIDAIDINSAVLKLRWLNETVKRPTLKINIFNLDQKNIEKLLNHCSKVISLDLTSNDIDEDGAWAIASSPHLNNLTSLDLTDNKINAEGIGYIANSQYLTKLSSLTLEFNGIGGKAILELKNATFLNNLKSLNLSKNRFGTNDLKELSKLEGLKLTSLYLSNTNISLESLKVLLSSSIVEELTFLDLSNNRLTDESAKILAQSENLKHLISVNISNNSISTDGIKNIISSPQLPKLKNVFVSRDIFNLFHLQILKVQPDFGDSPEFKKLKIAEER